MFREDGNPRPPYGIVLGEVSRMGAGEWGRRVELADKHLLDVQAELGLPAEETAHPVDYFPRIVSSGDWEWLERGLSQRILALKEWLRRLERGEDEVVPREVVESSTLYDPPLTTRFGDVPNRQMGFDVVAVGEGDGWGYRIIEDNAKMPVGIEPMSLMRRGSAEVLPRLMERLGLRPLDGFMERFAEVVRGDSPVADPTLAILSTGPDDQYYLDHRFFVRELGAILAERDEVEVDRGGYLVHSPSGRRIDVIYERIEDGRIYDDLPGLVEAQASGRVRAVFAPNLGIADDKGVYPFIPEMIRTYLGEESVASNVETYSLAVKEQRWYVMDHFGDLVVKSRSGWGGKDIMIGPEGSREALEEFREQVERNPVEYVAQEVLDFSTHVLCEADETSDGLVLRDAYADYRMHALAPDAESVWVVPGAMTRVADPGSRLVNISSGGRMKDTWVLQ